MTSMVVSSNPLATPRPVALRLPEGTRFCDLAPSTTLPLMLKVNGEYLLRDEWTLPVCIDDHIEWELRPQGAGSRGLLQVLLLVAVVVIGLFAPGGWALAGQVLAIGSTALALFNLLVPLRQPNKGAGASPGSVYNVQLAGNQARLNEPIPVIYGRMLTFPDFAAQPYGEYVNNDQIYCALFCVGQGKYTIEQILVGNTPLQSFSDVSYEVLPPGSAPTLVLPNVVNAPEAGGQDIKTAIYTGAFAACGPGLRATAVAFDIIFGNGLVTIDGTGTAQNATVQLRFDAQQIDDFGVAVGAWYSLNTETITAKSTTTLRRSFKYTLSAPARVQVRVGRVNAFIDSLNTQNSPVLGGIRAYLSLTAPLCATATHIAVRIRASAQLTQFSQNRISVIARRWLRSWSPAGGGTWAAEAETRSIAWAIADAWTSTVYGDGLPDSRVDLQTLYDLEPVWAARQDRLDILFDSKVPSWDAVHTMAQVGRARPFRRAGVCTLWRDQLQTLPVTAFTSRNMLPGLDMGYSLATEITADGVLLEYFSNRTWKWETVTCPAPGVITPTNAPRIRVAGITGSYHARREGLYQAGQNVYRRKFPKWQTELTGLLPAYGSLVLYSPDIPGYGQTGDVVDFNTSTLVMTLSEAPVFTPGAAAHYISLQRDVGTMTNAIACLPGPTDKDVVLAIAPDFMLVLDDANRERPKYIFGKTGEHRVPALVLGIAKRARDEKGAQIIEIQGVGENELIHGLDNALLPGPGVVQDPVDSSSIPISGGGSSGVTIPVLTLVGVSIVDGGSVSGGGTMVARRLKNDGTSEYLTGGGGTTALPGQWLLLPNALDAALFEVRATDVNGVGCITGSALNVWLALSATRTWSVDVGVSGTVLPGGVPDQTLIPLRLEVRRIADPSLTLASVNDNLQVNWDSHPP